MFDIDCHIIIHKEPRWKIDRCLSSLQGQPVNLHFVVGEDERPPFKGRAKGFAMGCAPYVCYVDPDDWVEPNCFARLTENLGPDVVHGWERIVRDGKELGLNSSYHHAFAIKRGIDIPYELQIMAVLPYEKRLKIKEIPEVLYTWDLTGGRYGR